MDIHKSLLQISKNLLNQLYHLRMLIQTIQCVVRPDLACYLEFILITPLTFGKDHGYKTMFCLTQKP